ncbi:MAG: RNA polymerase sigma factor [Myxococcota bacterium]|nr:RNA polymerase sigma factor [Myxococcota bacterium]
MNARSDEELMRRVREGDDPSAFDALFRRYAGKLNAFFLRQIGDPEAARDLVQQSFLQLHRARRDYQPGAPFRPWIYTIAANLRRMHHRRRARKPEVAYEPDAHEPSVGPKASTPEQRAVRRALMAVNEGQREVLILHWYQGLPMEEVAQVLGISRSAAKVRAHRAYKALQALLGEDK